MTAGVQLNASEMLGAAVTPPTLAAMGCGSAMVKGALHGIAGSGSGNVPGFAVLLAVGRRRGSGVPWFAPRGKPSAAPAPPNVGSRRPCERWPCPVGGEV
jgi:hypothetical protein